MTIRKELFIDAAMKFGYALDAFPEKEARQQIEVEFDELLALNHPDILNARCKNIGIGQPNDYLHHQIDTPDGPLLAGMRHVSCDTSKPFVLLWPTFAIDSIKSLLPHITPYFERFKPSL